MNERRSVQLADVPSIAPSNRLQFEPAQNAHILLYPEGLIRLSDSAAEILKRVDGSLSITQIIAALSAAFPDADLQSDVLDFLNIAYERGWICIAGAD